MWSDLYGAWELHEVLGVGRLQLRHLIQQGTHLASTPPSGTADQDRPREAHLRAGPSLLFPNDGCWPLPLWVVVGVMILTGRRMGGVGAYLVPVLWGEVHAARLELVLQ